MTKIKKNIEIIKAMWFKRIPIKTIADKFNVNRHTIESLLVGKTFKGTGKVKEPDNRSKGRKVVITFNNKDIVFGNVEQVGLLFGLSGSSVSNMIAGRHPYPQITSIRIDEDESSDSTST